MEDPPFRILFQVECLGRYFRLRDVPVCSVVSNEEGVGCWLVPRSIFPERLAFVVNRIRYSLAKRDRLQLSKL